eukprot:TRINITY_DN38227_c0_g1_i1.p2 TRINITY_DN38227_c0_g1~~TRINITY_DN38227_c0_g1_i1.p2  ORF type:complete len:142 (+),score=24.40 TRINITY_DN38227_c0_g1_i1:116-541(+)
MKMHFSMFSMFVAHTLCVCVLGYRLRVDGQQRQGIQKRSSALDTSDKTTQVDGDSEDASADAGGNVRMKSSLEDVVADGDADMGHSDQTGGHGHSTRQGNGGGGGLGEGFHGSSHGSHGIGHHGTSFHYSGGHGCSTSSCR